MTYTNFYNLCKYAGDQSLSEANRWQSIKYISFITQKDPPFDLQYQLAKGAIEFVTIGDSGGFIIEDYPWSSLGNPTSNHDIIDYFIPVESIASVTFIMKSEAENATEIGLQEYLKELGLYTGTVTKYVDVQFTNSRYAIKIDELNDFSFTIKTSRDIGNNYTITYYDSYYNKLSSKPTKIGKYFVKLTCNNNFKGEAETLLELQ